MMAKYTNHEHKIYLHAEISAIVKCISKYGNEILPECSLYVMRISRGNNVSLSKPCETCQKVIDAFGIKKVYWT